MKAPEQIKMLRRLSQQAAAKLISVSPRRLRDELDAPRNDDGSYNAIELVAWHRGRTDRPELPDEDYERVLVAREHLVGGFCGLSDYGIAAVFASLDELRHRHGDGVLLMVMDLTIQQGLSDAADIEPTPAQAAAQAEAKRKREAEQAARDALQIAYVCERCKRLRRGRKWVKTTPATGYLTIYDYCPGCE